jgi:hypothetical protein
MKRQRNNMQVWTKAEHAIYNAMQEVEKMDADVLLTKAVVLLSDAQNAVADYLDLHPEAAKEAISVPAQQGVEDDNTLEISTIYKVDKNAEIKVGDTYFNVSSRQIERCDYDHEANSCNNYKPELIWKILSSYRKINFQSAAQPLQPSIEEVVRQFHEWQVATFPNATPKSKLKHLEQEVVELIVELTADADNENVKSEYADCFALLFGSAMAKGYTVQDISNFMLSKLEVNKKRKWGQPDADGVVNHVKEDHI